MKCNEDRIIEITVSELYSLYLEREMYEFMDFNQYKIRFIELGVNVIED